MKPDSAVVIDFEKDFSHAEPETILTNKFESGTRFRSKTPTKDSSLHPFLSVLPPRTPSPDPPVSKISSSYSASMSHRSRRDSDQAVPFNNQVTGRRTLAPSQSLYQLEPEFQSEEGREGNPGPQDYSLWIRDPQEQLLMKPKKRAQQGLPPTLCLDPRGFSYSLTRGNPPQGQLPKPYPYQGQLLSLPPHAESHIQRNRTTLEISSHNRHHYEEPMEGVEFEVSPLKRARPECSSMKSPGPHYMSGGPTSSFQTSYPSTHSHFSSTRPHTPTYPVPSSGTPPNPSSPVPQSTLVTFTQDMTPTRKGALRLKW